MKWFSITAAIVAVSEPRLIPQNRFLDFGFGFYTTTNKAQAISFADKVVRRRRTGERFVSIYLLDETAVLSQCRVLPFEAPDEAWLDFVSANRTGCYQGEMYDPIIGPVANDDVYTTLIENLTNRDQNVRGNLNYLLTALSRSRRAAKCPPHFRMAVHIETREYMKQSSLASPAPSGFMAFHRGLGE